MKKYILLLCCAASLSLAASAQTAADAPKTKEEKARIKDQQEADLTEAFKYAGLSDAQISSVREALEAASKASKDVRANTALSEEQKVEAKNKINADKNTRLKEIMGADAYRKWNEIRKQQKTRAGQAEPAQ